MDNKQEIILKLRGLKTHFPVRKGIFKRLVGYVKAVDGIDLDIYRGETLGVVGESGCGKSSLGKSLLRLIDNVEGQVSYYTDNRHFDLLNLAKEEEQQMRKKMQIIFQDPYSSLNPVFSIFSSLEMPLKKWGIRPKTERKKIVGELLESVNLRPEYMDRYPNEFSGGQRQRIGIARALSVNPEFIICDEAVSALDVSIQAQVLLLLRQLKEERNLTYIFITHDLSVVEYISDRIAVMYLGKIVELADNTDLYAHPRHPYTQALLSAIPVADLAVKTQRIVLKGDIPSPMNAPPGCAFHPRCPISQAICRSKTPELKKYLIDEKEHFVACHFAAV